MSLIKFMPCYRIKTKKKKTVITSREVLCYAISYQILTKNKRKIPPNSVAIGQIRL